MAAAGAVQAQDQDRTVDLPTPHLEGTSSLNACAQTDLRISMYLSALTTHFFNTVYSQKEDAELNKIAEDFVNGGIMPEDDWHRLYWMYSTPEEKANFLAHYTAKEMFADTIEKQADGAKDIPGMRGFCGPQELVPHPKFPG